MAVLRELIARIKLDVKPALDASDKTIGASLRQNLDRLRYLAEQTHTLVIVCT